MIPLVAFAYFYIWSSKWNENVWDGFMLDYFNPFIIGVAIALILVLWNCIGLGLFSSHKERSKWNQLSEEEKMVSRKWRDHYGNAEMG